MWIKSKGFLFFLFAFESNLYYSCFSKFFKLFLCEKHVFLGVFMTYFMCKLSHELNGPNLKFSTLYREFHDCFTSKVFSRFTSEINFRGKLTSEITSKIFARSLTAKLPMKIFRSAF